MATQISDGDRAQLLRALSLARGAIGVSDPNPRVGCVVADAEGKIVGEGCTQAAGGAHAEVMALQAAQLHGHSCIGGTAWVTLEPCAHCGRTGPCCDALIAAGLSRVVVAMIDPFPQVAGKGVQRLREASIHVDLVPASDLISKLARELNIGFLSRQERGRPWVRLKVAASIDGGTALGNGVSQWITSVEARQDGHEYRRRAGAIVTGVGTILADNPRLNVRTEPRPLDQPLRVVMDSHLRTPTDAKVLEQPGQAVIMCNPTASQSNEHDLRAVGALVARVDFGLEQQVSPHAVLDWLYQRSINEVHLEAGPRINASWLASGLVDELVIYLAPCLLGIGTRPLAQIGPLEGLASAPRFEFVEAVRIASDLRVVLRRMS